MSAPERAVWLGNVLALALVLVVGFAVVGTPASFSADEGAAIVQVRLLNDGSWTMAHPAPEVDPSGRWFPLEYSVRVDDGFAPYVKHPGYPLLLRPFEAIAGLPGMVAASALATVALAVVTAQIAGRLAPGRQVTTLWLAGVASPALFNSYLVIAHTLGAAMVATAIWMVLCALDDRRMAWRAGWIAAAAAMLLGAVLMRSEAVLLGLALGLAVLLWARTSIGHRIVSATAITAWTAAAYLFDGWWSQAVLGQAGVEPFTIGSSGSFVSTRLTGFSTTWLRPTLSTEVGLAGGLLLLGAFGWLAVGYLLRTRPQSERLVVVCGLALGLLAVVRFLVEPSVVVPGLLAAFPILGAGLMLAPRSGRGLGQVLTGAFILFSLAVLATQYASGGSSQWGGRYFLIGLPLIIPPAVAAAAELRPRLHPSTWTALSLAAIATSAVLAATALVGLRDIHAGTATANAHIWEEAIIGSDGLRPIVIATRGAVPRLAHEQLDEARWLLVPPDELSLALDALARVGEPHVSIVDDTGALGDLSSLGGYERSSDAARGRLVVWRLELAD